MNQDLLVFDLMGKFGHFKKFYTNSSSLTYPVPPRTAIAGIIASVMEMSRDSYYKDLNTENANIGVKILSPFRKHLECMNYIRYKEGKSYNENGYTQTRLELLLPCNDLLAYRIYFSHKSEKFLKEFENRIKKLNLGYGVYLGQRPFIASLKFVERISGGKIKKLKNFNTLNTVTSLSNVIYPIVSNESQDCIRERMPMSFEKVEDEDSGREITEVGDFLIETSGKQLTGRFREGYQIIYASGEKENICFLKK